MAPVSWKALTSSRLSSLKDYVAQKDYKATYDALSARVRGHRDSDDSGQTWDQWARQALGRPHTSSTDLQRSALCIEKVQLFPGWAVRRPITEDGAEFCLDIYVSGFASSLRPPEAATRSQKAFYRLAKGYAALPKLPTLSISDTPQDQANKPHMFDSLSDVDLSKLPPLPSEITDETELEALEAHLRDVSGSSSLYSSDDEDDVSLPRLEHPASHTDTSYEGQNLFGYQPPRSPRIGPQRRRSYLSRPSIQPVAPLPEQMVDYAAQRLHANLDARLQPFWSNAIPNRKVRLSVFCPFSGHAPSEAQDTMEGQDTDPDPLVTMTVTTTPQGAFQTTFNVPWERLATHPPTLHLAFGDRDVEYPMVIQAEMWAPPPVSSSGSSTPPSVPYSPYKGINASRSHPQLPSTFSLASSSSSSQSLSQAYDAPSIQSRVTVSLSIPHVPIRVISDIDDTIKHAGILLGAKHVFQNVFVRHLDELVIHPMVDWYKALWQQGVRFHYVSNSPFELLPVLTDFFQVSSLPQGSIRLKSYAARSLLPALLSPPAARKRQGVVEVLDAFPESRFILVGDTGEQDMELYAELARERPRQVVGVFLRNVTTDAIHHGGLMPSGVGQSFGAGSVGNLYAHFGGSVVNTEPEPVRSMPSMQSLNSVLSLGLTSVAHPQFTSYGSDSYSSGSYKNPATSVPKFPGTRPQKKKSTGGMTPEERRRHELETRIERARAEIPSHTAFRVFLEPNECVEVQGIMDRFMKSNS